MNRRDFIRRVLGAGAALYVPTAAVSTTSYFFPGLWTRPLPAVFHVKWDPTSEEYANMIRHAICKAHRVPFTYLVPPGGTDYRAVLPPGGITDATASGAPMSP